MRTDTDISAGMLALVISAAVAFAAASAVAVLALECGPGWVVGVTVLVAGPMAVLLANRYRGLAAAARRAEAQWRDSERFSRALMEHSSDLIAVLSPDGSIRFASPSHAHVLGYAPEELVGRNAFDFVHPEDQPTLLDAFARAIGTSGLTVLREFRFRHRDGSWRTIEAAARSALADPAIAGAVINSRDVTERRRAEDALRASAHWLELLLSQLPALVWTVDPQLRITSASGAALQRLGRRGDEGIGISLAQYFGSDDPAFLPIAAHRRALAGVAQDYEFTWMERCLLTHIEPLRDESGEIIGVVGIAQDVTASRRAEGDKAALLDVAHDIAGTLELQEVLERVGRRTVAVVPCDGVAICHRDGVRETVRLVSQSGVPAALGAAMQALHGPAPAGETVVCNDVAERSGPFIELADQFGIAALAIAPLSVRGRSVGTLVAFNSGSRRFHPPQVQLLESIGRQLAVAIEAADFYAAQREEAAVAAALARIGRALISELDRPLLLERLCRVTVDELRCDISRTYLLDDVRGEYVAVASAGDSPEQWEAVRALRMSAAQVDVYVDGFRQGDVAEIDVRSLTGSDVPLSTAHATPRVLAMALRRGGALVGVHAARFLDRTEPCTLSQQRIAYGVAQLASLALENARLVEELDRANRVKGDFVASMSHELRTPLNVIIGYSDLLVDQIFGELSVEQRETVRRIGDQGRELLELVNTTLDMSRLESGRIALAVEEVDLVDLLAEIELEAQLVRRNAALEVTWHVSSDVPPLWTDPMKLKVVIKNLLLNALKFTDEGGVVVRTRAIDAGVEIAVSDSGIGIAPEMIQRIFEPFRQGDHGGARRGGVGLGLHIVRRLLDMLGGRIEVESELHRGSTFRVWVPVRGEEGRRRDTPDAARPSGAVDS